MNSIPCGSPLTAKMWDDLRRMFGWQRQEIQVRNEERGQILCQYVSAEHSLVGLWMGKQEMELSGGQQLLNSPGPRTSPASISERTVCRFDGHVWPMQLTVRACCIHQPSQRRFIYVVTFTDAGSWKPWLPASNMIVWWWIAPRHITMIRQAMLASSHVFIFFRSRKYSFSTLKFVCFTSF